MNVKVLNIASNQPYGILKYAFGKDGCELITSTLFSDPRDLKACSREMASRMAMGKGKVKLAHVILSAHPDDRLSNSQWAEMVGAVIGHYGRATHPANGDWNLLAMAAKHKDRDHVHTHLILPLVGPDGKMFNRSMERVHLRNLAKKFEAKWGITETPMFSERPSRFSKPEIEKGHRLCVEGRKLTPCPERLDLRATLQSIAPAARSFAELESLLGKNGITVAYRLNAAGQRCGISFAQGDVRLTGKNAGLNFRKLEEIYGNEANEINRIGGRVRTAPASTEHGQSDCEGVGAGDSDHTRAPQRITDRAKYPVEHNRTATRAQHADDRGILAATESILRQVTGGKRREDPLVLLLNFVFGQVAGLCDENDRSIGRRRSMPMNL
jgi:hypothetical protein